MKRLLSIIGAISIVGSGASAAIACGVTEPHIALETPNTTKAKAVAKAIKTTAIDVPYTTNQTISNTATKAKIFTILKQYNLGLSAVFAKNNARIVFNSKDGVTDLTPGKPITIIATIVVGSGSSDVGGATKDLQVTWVSETDQQKAYAVAQTINAKDISVLSTTDETISILATQTAIKIALETANPDLTAAIKDNDAKITYKGKTVTDLTPGTAVDVIATITVGKTNGGSETKDLKVKLELHNQQKADNVANAIVNKDVVLSSTSASSVSNQDTINAIKTGLEALNQGLKSIIADNEAIITFKGTSSLVAGSAVDITATVTIGTVPKAVTATVKNIKVTLANTNQQNAQAIFDSIVNRKITLVTFGDVNTDVTKQLVSDLIWFALWQTNKSLITALASVWVYDIAFSNGPLVPNTAVTLTAVVIVGTGEGAGDATMNNLIVTLNN